MEFEFEAAKDGDVVAVMWASHLVLKDDDGDAVVLCGNTTMGDNVFVSDNSFDYYLNDTAVKQKFYKGDKITITF